MVSHCPTILYRPGFHGLVFVIWVSALNVIKAPNKNKRTVRCKDKRRQGLESGQAHQRTHLQASSRSFVCGNIQLY